MKKIILKGLGIVLIISLLLCAFVSCNEEEENEGDYYVYGLHFNLGEGYKSITVPYAENCYTNGESFFFFHVYSGEGLEELGFLPDISVERYTQQFCLLNSLDPYDYEYDSARDVATLDYVHIYDKDDEGTAHLDPEFYFHIIMRGTEHLYIITMSCDEADRETYEPIFKSRAEKIYAD